MTTTIQIEEINGKFVLPLSSELLEELGVQSGDQVDVTMENGKLVMRSSASEDDANFERLKDKMFDEYSEVFTTLAEGLK
jgi:formylmethanofuran dehydrogenase subunit D